MKAAFTYLELVIVIVLIGILAVISVDRFQRDHLYEAADQIMAHIRYSQHLSMIDDRYDPGIQNWKTQQYRIQFHNSTNNNAYSIYKDMDNDNDLSVGDIIVKDPATNKLICGRSSICSSNRLEKVDIATKYGIDISVSNASSARQILFDYLGRPLYHDGAYPSASVDNIEITLTAADGESLVIEIATETGFISIS